MITLLVRVREKVQSLYDSLYQTDLVEERNKAFCVCNHELKLRWNSLKFPSFTSRCMLVVSTTKYRFLHAYSWFNVQESHETFQMWFVLMEDLTGHANIGSVPFGSFFTALLSVSPSFLLSQIFSVL